MKNLPKYINIVFDTISFYALSSRCIEYFLILLLLLVYIIFLVTLCTLLLCTHCSVSPAQAPIKIRHYALLPGSLVPPVNDSNIFEVILLYIILLLLFIAISSYTKEPLSRTLTTLIYNVLYFHTSLWCN